LPSLPTPGGDAGTWGDELNEFLEVAHEADGRLKSVPYNVRDYGATGDGVTDDRASIQEAIDAASAAGGGIVFFQAGTYLIEAQLTVPSFVTLRGVGGVFRAVETSVDPDELGAMITGPAVTSFDMISNENTTTGDSSISIEGLWIGLGGSTTADVAPISFTKVWRSVVKDCYIRGAVTANRYGFRHRSLSENNMLIRNKFEGCGIHVEADTNRLFVDACQIAQGGIDIAGGYAHIIQNNDIFQDGGTDPFAIPIGIKMTGTTNALITGNQLTHCRQHGIYIPHSTTRAMVIGNTIKNCSQQSAGIWSGINIDSSVPAAPTENNVVMGNICYDEQIPKTQNYGIVIESTSGSQTNDNVVVGNNVADNLTGGLIEEAGLSNVVHSNVGATPDANADTSGATLPQLETEVNQLKQTLRDHGLLGA
jgi:parallel beta-helix repeat protein